MPADQGTLTPQDVADYLGVPVDERMTGATDAVRTWFHDTRPSIPQPWWNQSIHYGGVLRAAAEYLSRATPEGMAGYDPTLGGFDSYTLVHRADLYLPAADPVVA